VSLSRSGIAGENNDRFTSMRVAIRAAKPDHCEGPMLRSGDST
jgi:hypothetical protein